MHGCCHICYPNSCCDGKQAWLVLLVDGVRKFDQNYVGEVDRARLKTYRMDYRCVSVS